MRGGIRVGGPGNRRRGLREGRWPGRLTVGVHASQRHAGQRRRTGWSSGLHREHARTHAHALPRLRAHVAHSHRPARRQARAPQARRSNPGHAKRPAPRQPKRPARRRRSSSAA